MFAGVGRAAAVRGVAIASLLAFSVMLTKPSVAQTAEGFSLNRFDSAERGSEWFAAESLDLRGHGRFAAGMVFDYAYRPLIVYDQSREREQASIVGHQMFAHVGGNVVLWERLRLGLNLPVAFYQTGDGAIVGGTNFVADDSFTVGDLRVSGDVRVLGDYAEPITLAGGIQVFAPTGSQAGYTGDGAVRVEPRVLVAGTVQQFTYSGHVGFDFRARDAGFAGSPMGSEVTLGAAAGVRVLDDRLTLGPELFGSTGVTDADAFFGRTSTPFELLFGAHLRPVKAWQFGAGVGPGLTRAFGTPTLRVLLSAEFIQPYDPPKEPPKLPPPPPPDRDHDGIFDGQDACPDVAGVKTDDPATNGCPPRVDSDGDGVFDDEDACIETPGVRSEDPKRNGCPPDRDADGIIDEQDACPDEPGIATQDPKTNGCPPPKDRDGDSILDEQDACPDAAGQANEDPTKHGCPIAHIEKDQIRIREQVQFAYNSAEILKASDFILSELRNILEANPQVKLVEVQGHTDARGSDRYNQQLSERRAASVVRWLVAAGVERSRLRSRGFGESNPIDTNETDEGRANNRRVEFHIIEQDKVVETVVPAEARPPAATPSQNEQ